MPLPRLWTALASGVLAAALAEVALRCAGFEHPSLGMRAQVWNEAEDAGLRAGTGLHAVDARQIWRPRPGAELPWAPGEHVNARGFRGPELPLERTSGVPRIALLGAETVFGPGLRQPETLAARLTAEFAQRGRRVEVLDASVLGSTLRQGLERYQHDVRPYRPDVVVSAHWGRNEHLAAPDSIVDEERITGAKGPPLAEIGRRVPLRDDLRLVQVGVWLGELYFGRGWEERDAELRALRRARQVATFGGGGERRMGYNELRDALVKLAELVRADGARLVGLATPVQPGGRFDHDVLRYYFLAVALGCESSGTPLACDREPFSRLVAAAGVKPEELARPDGELSARAVELLARGLADVLTPLLDEVRR